MLNWIRPLAAGNALQLGVSASGASRLRLLRRPDDAFTGPDDAAAYLVAECDVADAGEFESAVLDTHMLVNGTRYHYRLYGEVGAAWDLLGEGSAVPAATYGDESVDVLSLVRERLEAGLRVEVQRGTLRPKGGAIAVLSAPPVFEETRWPVVVVSVQNDGPQVRALGEMLEEDETDGFDWTEHDGWLASQVVNVQGWSLNPDERIALRKALRRLVVANLPVFAAAGLQLVEFHQTDDQDFERYSAPVYITQGRFSCLAPVQVTSEVDAIDSVETTATIHGVDAVVIS